MEKYLLFLIFSHVSIFAFADDQADDQKRPKAKDALKKELVYKFAALLEAIDDGDLYQYFESTSSQYMAFEEKMAEKWKITLARALRLIQRTRKGDRKKRIMVLAALWKAYLLREQESSEEHEKYLHTYFSESNDIRKDPRYRVRVIEFIDGVEEVYSFAKQRRIPLITEREFERYYIAYNKEKIKNNLDTLDAFNMFVSAVKENIGLKIDTFLVNAEEEAGAKINR